ncbi:hypothetical protein BV25DRAFT_642312 [Artomyces pyxidatus]|uniref:Uncharacterized protein n=1 Tax=Artomyces pyxidatus TaxID=48021 RepID=A0ACB8T182_9AGAM|nr:hypothetical protein BV25DRAFT_642312 [Artomyces pyxidatus]
MQRYLSRISLSEVSPLRHLWSLLLSSVISLFPLLLATFSTTISHRIYHYAFPTMPSVIEHFADLDSSDEHHSSEGSEPTGTATTTSDYSRLSPIDSTPPSSAPSRRPSGTEYDISLALPSQRHLLASSAAAHTLEANESDLIAAAILSQPSIAASAFALPPAPIHALATALNLHHLQPGNTPAEPYSPLSSHLMYPISPASTTPEASSPGYYPSPSTTESSASFVAPLVGGWSPGDGADYLDVDVPGLDTFVPHVAVPPAAAGSKLEAQMMALQRQVQQQQHALQSTQKQRVHLMGPGVPPTSPPPPLQLADRQNAVNLEPGYDILRVEEQLRAMDAAERGAARLRQLSGQSSMTDGSGAGYPSSSSSGSLYVPPSRAVRPSKKRGRSLVGQSGDGGKRRRI